MRVLLEKDPFAGRPTDWLNAGQWPCRWIGPQERSSQWVCRLQFTVDTAETVRIHVSADEKYRLYLDGVLLGHGPERGDLAHWFYDSYDLELPAGEHVLAAMVWSMGSSAPRSQITLRPGFICAPQDPAWLATLGTGEGKWQVRTLNGWTTQTPFSHGAFSIGFNTKLEGSAFAWDWLESRDGWGDAVVGEMGSVAGERNRHGEERLLRPASLPAQLDDPVQGGVIRHLASFDGDFAHLHNVPVRSEDDLKNEHPNWAGLTKAEPVTIPPHTAWRVIVDWRDYVCAYPALITSDGEGARIRLFWAESLYQDQSTSHKGHRDEIEGKYFSGVGDEFACPGGQARRFEPPFWRAGRYLELAVVTGDEPLELTLAPRSTGYPLHNESEEQIGEPWDAILKLCRRTVSASCHDAFTDGPFYEQMTWAGDCLQNVLALFAMSSDVRPVRKALELFAASRAPEGHHGGLPAARWPARDRLHIAPYALYWVALLHEYAYWRDDLPTVRRLMPMARSVLDNFRAFFTPDGILGPPPGWNFVDWVPGWDSGIPPGADREPSAILNWQLAWTYALAAKLETALDEPELAARWSRLGRELADRITPIFWKAEPGLFADDVEGSHFSEHAQVFALLSGYLDAGKQALLERQFCDEPQSGLARCTISFTHHLFEAYRQMGRPDALLRRMAPWTELPKQGFLTTPEAPEPTRSDCHAWSAHPLYHFHATLAGIRPAAPGFARVAVEPQLGTLSSLSVVTPHPAGLIRAEFRREGDALRARVTLPAGVSGQYSAGGLKRDLRPGLNEI